MGHRPGAHAYVRCVANRLPPHSYVANLLRTAYEDALKTFKIDLAIFGHHHTYQVRGWHAVWHAIAHL